MTATAARDDALDLPNGRQLGWCEFGDPTGRPIMYCHGLPGSRLEAALLAPAAAERGLRILAPDRPGFGKTSPRPGRVVGEEVVDIEALMEALELPHCDALGFSGGGPHAMAFAARAPDRVQRVTLVSSLAPFDCAGTDGMAEGFRELWAFARSDFPAFEAALEDAVTQAGDFYGLLAGGAPEADRTILQAREVAATYRQDMDEAMRQGFAGVFEDAHAVVSSWAFDVADVSQPVRQWHGELDGNAPLAMGRWLQRRLPEAVLIAWPGAAHFEVFRRWGEVLDWHVAD